MHKVKKLEDRWLNYKMKKFISPAIKISSLYLLIVGSYYLYTNKSEMLFSLVPSNGMTKVLGVSLDANESEVENKVLKKEMITENIISTPKAEEPKIKEPEALERIALSPIIPVINMEKEERISDVKRKKTLKYSRPVKVANTVKAKKNNYLTAKELAVITKKHQKEEVLPRKTKKMHFTSTSSNYIETMKQKFSKSNSPRDALLIAKNYYKKSDYLSSEQWALSANKLDNSLEESWLLFAKAKVKLGKKKEALKVLVSYYKKSHSIKAKRLIGQIKTGRI